MFLKSLYTEVNCSFMIYETVTAVWLDVAKVTFLFCTAQNFKVFWCLDYSFWKVWRSQVNWFCMRLDKQVMTCRKVAEMSLDVTRESFHRYKCSKDENSKNIWVTSAWLRKLGLLVVLFYNQIRRSIWSSDTFGSSTCKNTSVNRFDQQPWTNRAGLTWSRRK